ncbi:MAG: bifunctional metallophosphatase/5'-nucleotidase [Candidatus Limivicinus sp.]|jgi:5'-nucleotidase/UDP-sugar diphosphatase
MNLKKLTILHSNDMHGDFMAEQMDDRLVGGVSRLSGYIQKVRKEEKNVLYTISGDMFRGSLIDSEYKGLSTIEMMNLLNPDVVTLGNHEVDYGLAHLLFIEKCAKFPIINANMYITMNHRRLFRSHIILEVDGMKILFIGVLTESVLSATKRDKVIGSIVDVADAAKEVGKICNAYRTEDIDFTVLLTHIGFEADRELAAALDPRWGVDLIIGGHSHTLLSEPAVVAGIPIVQAASGTDQIGRFDILVDTDKNAIHSYSWKLIDVDDKNCPRDLVLEEVLGKYKTKTEEKYLRIVSTLADRYTHPERRVQTELGTMLSDIFMESLDLDIMLLGSGSIRREYMGPIVTYQDILEVFPYDDAISQLFISGRQLRHMIEYSLKDYPSEEAEAYQYSKGLFVEYDVKEHRLISLKYKGREVQDDAQFRLGLQDYHLSNIEDFLGISLEEASAIKKPRVVATSSSDVLEEYFSTHSLIKAPEDCRQILR